MEVGRAGDALGWCPQLVLAFDCVGQRVRSLERSILTAQQQLRRVAVSATVLVHVDTVIEDREVGPAIAVEVRRDHNRVARLNRSFNQLRRVPETAVPLTGEHVQHRLREALLGGRAGAVLYKPSRENVFAAVAIEICDGEHEIEPAETRFRGDA